MPQAVVPTLMYVSYVVTIDDSEPAQMSVLHMLSAAVSDLVITVMIHRKPDREHFHDRISATFSLYTVPHQSSFESVDTQQAYLVPITRALHNVDGSCSQCPGLISTSGHTNELCGC
jgi:hypothetical protein